MSELQNHHSIVGVNVKQRSGFYDFPEDVREREGFEQVAERVSEWAASDFWSEAEGIAVANGFAGVECHGRSGGYAVPMMSDATIQADTGDYLPRRLRSLTEEEIHEEKVECDACCYYTGEADPECEECKGSGKVANPWRDRFTAFASEIDAERENAEAQLIEGAIDHYAEVDAEINRVAYWNSRDVETV